jgi:hypothetical protein
VPVPLPRRGGSPSTKALLESHSSHGAGASRSGPSLMPLFTGVRGRIIFRSPYPALCMDQLAGSPEDPIAPVLCMEVNTTCVSPAWISALVNGKGRSTRRLRSLVGSLLCRFGGPSSACHIWIAKEAARRNLRALDPSLTLTRTQYPAIVSKRRNNKLLIYAGFANPCNAQQPLTAHS